MLSRARSDRKKARADISMKLGKNVNEHELFEYSSLANRKKAYFQDGVTKIQDSHRKKKRQTRE